MKSVLISIRPEWCEKIANGQKTIEIRKTKPKIDTPFKCYIYETKSDKKYMNKSHANTIGTVVGEFVCDYIIESNGVYGDKLFKTGLSFEDLQNYGKGQKIYGWHISDLVIYYKPKKLSDFRKPCIMPEMPYCPKCAVGSEYISETEAEFYRVDGECNTEWRCLNYVTRPPQSWCYVKGDVKNA